MTGSRYYVSDQVAVCESCAKREGIDRIAAAREYLGAAALVCAACYEEIRCDNPVAPPAPESLPTVAANATAAPCGAPALPDMRGGLFGVLAETGAQQRLFPDAPTAASSPAPAVEWSVDWSPRPATAADRRIAKQYSEDGTDNLF